jgi:hypothetical protein
MRPLLGAADSRTHADLGALLGKRLDHGVGRPGIVVETATDRRR